jgi:hypothetical protein
MKEGECVRDCVTRFRKQICELGQTLQPNVLVRTFLGGLPAALENQVMLDNNYQRPKSLTQAVVAASRAEQFLEKNNTNPAKRARTAPSSSQRSCTDCTAYDHGCGHACRVSTLPGPDPTPTTRLVLTNK